MRIITIMNRREGHRGHRRRPSSAAVALAAVAAFGAASDVAAKDQEPRSDMEVQDAVEDQILLDEVVNLHGVDVSVADGIVTLSGHTGNVLAKERLVDLAEVVKGVRGVVNRIEVRPSVSPSGEKLARDVNSALLSDPVTDSFEIDVNATDAGVVTLAGTVQSWRERDITVDVTKGVKGVVSVQDDIDVDVPSERPDAEIENEIKRSLERDVLVDGYGVDVAVEDGDVTLGGFVGSLAEKRRCENLAWVSGVSAVDSDDLTIESWAEDDDVREHAWVAKSNQELEDAVEDALRLDPRVLSFPIEADARGSVVTLRGEVDNLNARRAAEQDARHVVGVLRVKNRLKVETGDVPDDTIARHVREAIRRDPFLESYEILVTSDDGEVRLTGDVDSYYEKARADDAASKVLGVARVDNDLDVDTYDEPYVYSPFLDDWDVYSYRWYDYEPRSTMKTDSEIRDDIDSELFWSPFVDANEVEVSVDNGWATLEGDVDTWAERSAAVENAYEGGATWVINDLDVERTSAATSGSSGS